MKESLTIFFFANNNHLSNVKTLQSIYRQDYPHINLVVCNDCTYGFQGERLLNNFEAGRGANIEYLYFQENPWPMGECASQTQLWDRIHSDYYYVIHSGDELAEPDVLRRSVSALRLDRSLAAAVAAVEQWDDDHRKKIATTTLTKDTEAQGVFSAADKNQLQLHRLRDCMTVYRLEALKKLTYEEDDRSRFLSKQAMPQLLEMGRRIMVQPYTLCTYSQGSVQDQPIAEPAKLGRDTLNNIAKLLQQREQVGEDALFQAEVPPVKAPKRNIHKLLYKLSTLKKIALYAGGAVLLSIAAALFLLLEQPVFFAVGLGFLALAVCAAGLALLMLGLNIYYKKNPQRLVNV